MSRPRRRPRGAALTATRTRPARILAAAAALAAALALAAGALAAGRAGAAAPVLPYDQPPAAQPRVFAHYFPPFPRSLDNRPPAEDYYARHYLAPAGEAGKHAAYGGLLRDRPLGRPPVPGDWRTADYAEEVRQAADAGVDGFFVDVLSISGANWNRTVRLMRAAAGSGREFVVAPQIDATARVREEPPAAVAARMAELARLPSAYRDGGRFVLSAFAAEAVPVDWWREVIDTLQRVHRVKVAFRPVLLDARRMGDFAQISDAVGNWGARNPGSTLAAPDYAAQARRLGLRWIAPVSVQDARPRAGLYFEAGNLAQLRASWRRAIDDGADYAMLTTWNDYSETTSFAPSEAHGWTFLDVSGYYAARFRTGAFPAVRRDALYLTHRTQPAGAAPRLGHDLQVLRNAARDPARDTVEVMAFLTAPADLTITVGATTTRLRAAAGVTTYTVPLAAGQVRARADRAGTPVAAAHTAEVVVARPGVQDLQYVGAGSLRQPGR